MHFVHASIVVFLAALMACGSGNGGGDGNGPDAKVDLPNPPILTEGLATIVGFGIAGHQDGSRDEALFNNPVNVVVEPSGTILVADFNNDAIRRVTPSGVVSTVVSDAPFRRPFGMVGIGDGTLYVETDDNPDLEHSTTTGTIWRVAPSTGAITVIARDIGRPRGLVVLSDERIAFADHKHHTISTIAPDTGVITLLAGAVDTPGYVDAVGAAALFREPYDLVLDMDGSLLVSDFGNHRIRRVALDGTVTTVAGSGTAGHLDGTPLDAQFSSPKGMAIDADGNIYVSEIGNTVIRKIDQVAMMVSTFAGMVGQPGYMDNKTDPRGGQLFGLEGISVGGDYLYVADGNRGGNEPFHRIRRISLTVGN